MAAISKIQPSIHNWYIEEGSPTISKKAVKYRIVFDKKQQLYFIEKNIKSGWRKDNSFKKTKLSELVVEIENKI